jgi:hypothetical protein
MFEAPKKTLMTAARTIKPPSICDETTMRLRSLVGAMSPKPTELKTTIEKESARPSQGFGEPTLSFRQDHLERSVPSEKQRHRHNDSLRGAKSGMLGAEDPAYLRRQHR